MLFIRNNIPSKILDADNPVGAIENVVVEINLRPKNELLQILIT